MIRWLSYQLDRLIDWLMPVNLDGFGDGMWADELAEWEESHDVVEPRTCCCTQPFEPHDLTAPGFPQPDVVVTPAEPDPQPGFGGHFNFLRFWR